MCTPLIMNQTITLHTHGGHELTTRLAWPGWGPDMRALRLDHTALVRRGPTVELCKGRTYRYTRQSANYPHHHGIWPERLEHGYEAAAGVAHRVGLEW